MRKYRPATLPAVTSVDVVSLQGIDVNLGDHYMLEAAEALSVTLDGEDAQRIADLWRRLTPGDEALCHTPPYGLRFRSGTRIICQASICWECENIYGEAEGQDIHYEFDSCHPISKRLFVELSNAIGDREIVL